MLVEYPYDLALNIPSPIFIEGHKWIATQHWLAIHPATYQHDLANCTTCRATQDSSVTAVPSLPVQLAQANLTAQAICFQNHRYTRNENTYKEKVIVVYTHDPFCPWQISQLARQVVEAAFVAVKKEL